MNRHGWAQVEAERIALTGRVLALSPEEWDHPSRCQEWRVRDVLGHLVHLAETPLRSRAREPAGAIRPGRPRLPEYGPPAGRPGPGD
jgi:uncharacterized protein (TIGR03083 family)